MKTSSDNNVWKVKLNSDIRSILGRLGLLAAAIIISGCGEEESFSRYPSLCVPGFGMEEYISDLSSTNPEVVYNAVCKLASQANNFSKLINKDDADPASAEYQQAEEVFKAICRTAESEVALTAAVSLRFLQKFSSKHKDKTALRDVALRVQCNHPQVMYEQTVLLERVIKEDTVLPEELLKELLKSPSWIVSRTAYGLIGVMKDEPLRQELIRRCQDTEEDRERLVIIDALGRNLQPDEARIFEVEMLSTTNTLIRRTAMGVLICNLEVSGVRKSLVDHYSDFTRKEQAHIFDESEDIELACSFLEQGFVPSDKIMAGILEDLPDEDHKKADHKGQECELIKLAAAFVAAPQTAERWQALKNEAEQKRRKMAGARREAKPINETLVGQIQALRDKHSLNDSELKAICNELNKSMNALTEKQQSSN